MARQAIPVVLSNRKGTTAMAAATVPVAADDLSMVNDGRTVILVKSADAGSQNVTINFSETVDGQAVTPLVIPVAAGAELPLGPYPTDIYGKLMLIDVTVTTLTFRAVRVAAA